MEEEKKFSLRLEVRVKNSKLAIAREELRINAKQAAAAIGINYNQYLLYEAMKAYPTIRSIQKICEFYQEYGIQISKEEVFPEELKKIKPRKYTQEREIPVENLVYLSQPIARKEISYVPSPDEALMEKEVNEMVDNALKTLQERDEKVLRMRFGIGEEKHTLEEAAEIFNVTPERIRQIEKRALSCMRNPSRANKLKRVYDP